MAKLILVVDDDRMSLELVKRRVQEAGYETVTAEDGEQALAQLQAKLPSLVLLDVQMPKMNGYTFVMEKAKNPAFAAVPVIVLTAHTENEPLFKRHGVKGYLVKPINIQELLKMVAETIGAP